MTQLIHQYRDPLPAETGLYTVQAWGVQREDGTWAGWLVFVAADGTMLKTGQETSQSNLEGLNYWAGGIEPVYLEGALQRAREARPDITAA